MNFDSLNLWVLLLDKMLSLCLQYYIVTFKARFRNLQLLVRFAYSNHLQLLHFSKLLELFPYPTFLLLFFWTCNLLFLFWWKTQSFIWKVSLGWKTLHLQYPLKVGYINYTLYFCLPYSWPLNLHEVDQCTSGDYYSLNGIEAKHRTNYEFQVTSLLNSKGLYSNLLCTSVHFVL